MKDTSLREALLHKKSCLQLAAGLSHHFLCATMLVKTAKIKTQRVHSCMPEPVGSPAVAAVARVDKRNPKRVQREVRKQLRDTGIGTKSQQALKLQQERNKQARKTKSREQKLAEAQRLFELKQQKKKDRHRGH